VNGDEKLAQLVTGFCGASLMEKSACLGSSREFNEHEIPVFIRAQTFSPRCIIKAQRRAALTQVF
jgi:hypothetical protein